VWLFKQGWEERAAIAACAGICMGAVDPFAVYPIDFLVVGVGGLYIAVAVCLDTAYMIGFSGAGGFCVGHGF
jgi:hypothetical protein